MKTTNKLYNIRELQSTGDIEEANEILKNPNWILLETLKWETASKEHLEFLFGHIPPVGDAAAFHS